MRILNQVDTDTEKPRKSSGSRRRALLRDESGQSLIVVALALFVIVGVTAMAIDAATWYQKHHQAQVAADAAALAAANCLANGNTGRTCTSTTDTSGAIAVATNYAKNNGVTIPASDVSFDNATYPSQVTVTTPNSGRALFAGLFGITKGTQVAKATATWKTSGSDCSTAGVSCDFIFANDPSCSGGVTLTTNGTPDTMEGGIQSNGSIVLAKDTGNPTYSSDTTYQTGCTGPSTTQVAAPWPAKASTQSVPSTYPNDWPVDYRNIYAPCGSYTALTGTTVKCTGGIPNYCTYYATGSTNFTNPTQPGVYCAIGTGNSQDPSTWTGTITQTNAIAATYIGGTVSITDNGTGTVTPAAGNHLLAYAAQSGASLNVTDSGSGLLSGDLFDPFGTATVQMSGTPSGSGIFIEAFDVNYTSNGTASAAGPTDNSLGQPPPPPTDALSG